MADTQSLFDTLAGSFGHGVDRPSLNAFVANSQAANGLRTAQTDLALTNAQKQQEELQAHADLENSLLSVKGDDGNPLLTPSAAHLVKNELVGGYGDAKSVMEALRQAQGAHNTSVLSDPNQLGTAAQTAAQQGLTGKVAEPVAVPNAYTTLPGAAQPNVQMTPIGKAQANSLNASADLHQTQADAGGFAPKVANMGVTDPAAIAALQKAVAEGRLDPSRLNSRTANMYAQLEMQSPGTNYNRLHADATLQNNPTFQTKANGIEILPGILQHVTELGKKLDNGNGYSDIRTVGKLQQFFNGELNDPAYAEYMPVRNDALLRLAYLMRGQGASDQASKLENEAFAPTLAPYALDAWLKGQMSVLKPMIDKNNKIVHLGEPGMGTPSLGGGGGAPAATPGAPSLPSYPDEAAALAAGHKPGDRVMIGGVTGTLQ